jgi:hypothetical protein
MDAVAGEACLQHVLLALIVVDGNGALNIQSSFGTAIDEIPQLGSPSSGNVISKNKLSILVVQTDRALIHVKRQNCRKRRSNLLH